MDLISVVIPVYNTASQLPTCIESVLCQTYPHLEIILVNDGSTDDSGLICDRYAKQDSRILVLHKVNEGVSRARNSGVEASHGSFLGFVDSDDWIQPTMYEELLSHILFTKSDIGMCGYTTMSPNHISNDFVALHFPITMNHLETLEKLYAGPYIEGFLWNKLYRSALLKPNFLDVSLTVCEDLYFNTCLFANANHMTISYLAKPLYVYTQNESSATAHLFDATGNFIYAPAFQKLFHALAVKELTSQKIDIKHKYIDILRHSMYLLFQQSTFNKAQIHHLAGLMKSMNSYVLGTKSYSLKEKLYLFLIEYAPRLVYKRYH